MWLRLVHICWVLKLDLLDFPVAWTILHGLKRHHHLIASAGYQRPQGAVARMSQRIKTSSGQRRTRRECTPGGLQVGLEDLHALQPFCPDANGGSQPGSSVFHSFYSLVAQGCLPIPSWVCQVVTQDLCTSQGLRTSAAPAWPAFPASPLTYA